MYWYEFLIATDLKFQSLLNFISLALKFQSLTNFITLAGVGLAAAKFDPYIHTGTSVLSLSLTLTHRYVSVSVSALLGCSVLQSNSNVFVFLHFIKFLDMYVY